MRIFACPVCTKISIGRALCAHCAERLHARRAPVTRDLGVYQAHGLFPWRRDGFLALRWWAMALKQKEHDEFWAEAATWLIDAFGPPPSGARLVPVPTSARRNHARGLANAVARRSGAAVADVLVAKDVGHQRRRGLVERHARRFELGPGPVPRGPVLIVDDIITTGATIEAAHRALGRPEPCAAWCLMDRRPGDEIR